MFKETVVIVLLCMLGVCSAAVVYNVKPISKALPVTNDQSDLEGAESANPQFFGGGFGSPFGYGGYDNFGGGYGGYGGYPGYGGYGGFDGGYGGFDGGYGGFDGGYGGYGGYGGHHHHHHHG